MAPEHRGSFGARLVAVLTRHTPALIFVIALPLLWLRLGHWFYLSIDEGIYLDGAARVARGEVPYRDFFVVTGPGTFWLYGLLFHLFGPSLAHARLVLCCELALMCALICWLVGRFGGALLAAGSALLFLAMLLTTLYPLYVTHRWDSNTAALLALVFVWAATTASSKAGLWSVLTGFCIGLAVWMTPPMLVIAAAYGFWLAIESDSKRPIAWYAAGIATPSVLAVGLLFNSQALGQAARTLIWDTANYTAPNQIFYGALSGAWKSFFHPAMSPAISVIHFVESLLPAAVPILAVLGYYVVTRRKSDVTTERALKLIGLASLATLAACYPRFGAAQLLFALAPAWVLCSATASILLPSRGKTLLAGCLLIVASAITLVAWSADNLRRITTPVGTLNVSKRHHILLNDLQTSVAPRESVFVYPYLPALYFALGVHNPTRYSWLQPGMMGPSDEQAVLSDLRAHPPRWIVWHDFTEQYILREWPGSNPARMHYPEIEAFFQAKYHDSNPDGVTRLGYRLLEKN